MEHTQRLNQEEQAYEETSIPFVQDVESKQKRDSFKTEDPSGFRMKMKGLLEKLIMFGIYVPKQDM